MNGSWLIYGANGYTGRLIVEEARRRGLTPVVAGRRATEIEPLARAHGLEARVFGLDDPAALARGLDGVAAVLLAAGPFSATSRPVLAACLAAGVHYLDITGEIAVFEACLGQNVEAEARRISILPGVGFDVVPSDCLAARLGAALEGAIALELAFSGGGSLSGGTAKTLLEALPAGGLVREGGVIKAVPAAWKELDVPFRDRTRHAVSIPWGDVSTAYHSTKIPDITVYMAVKPSAVTALRLGRPLLGLLAVPALRRAVSAVIDRAGFGPGSEERSTRKAQLWGRVRDAAGRTVEGTLETSEGYGLTARTAVESVVRVLDGRVAPGARTPSLAFGAGYIETFEGCSLRLA